MSVLVVGLSHRSAPMDLLERAALGDAGAEALAGRLHAADHVSESLVLSTCNRLEVVVDAGTFHGAVTQVGEALCSVTGLTQEELTPHLYVHYDERAVSHLFSVACGLDSMAVGESQILGQLRAALAEGQRTGRIGSALNPLLQQALRVGKRAHAETSIDQVSRSLVGTGLERAQSVLGDLTGSRVVVVGAGAMSGLAIASLVREGITDVTVVNRTRRRADRLAELHGVRAADWDDLAHLVGAADLVLTCTGALGYVVRPDRLAQARVDGGRSGAPLVLLDLALPRDVDPGVTTLAGVHLWGLAELQDELASQAARELDGPVEAVRELVTGEVAAYLTELRAARLGPTLAALREQASRVVDAEMTRLDQRLPHLPDDERAEVRQAVQRVVDKLLHTPTVRAKQLHSADATSPGDYGQALRELFGLDPHEVAVVSTPPAAGPGGAA
ncbi:glutamyl-tRNA reductase [Ornithinimicrobium tianjinense]|uniref:Glutamyl-tRNA reductase n=1 Tax=Ornithinimicrobium tianjinense TaxID=1195761 RepID=A0A917BDC0_9MICO|nr:glutamyl-tRNA reductase [Ornithinimicrobium tianjinense]GGF37970.1 glutamyl-tRNA reductase [Ornithinimicrobium tianjinense]